jgi:hypothetical protein
MAEKGIDLATRAKILGHNSIRIVERYVDPTAEHTKRRDAPLTKRLRWRGRRPHQLRDSIEAGVLSDSALGREVGSCAGPKPDAGKR